MWIAVRKVDDQSEGDLVVRQVIQICATGCAGGAEAQRPADAVHDFTGLGLLGGNRPQLLEADAVVLRATVRVEVEFLYELLAQMSATTFRKQCVLCPQFVPGREGGFLLTVSPDTHIARCHAAHGAVVVVQNLGRGEAWKHVHTHRFGLLAQPAAQIPEADGMVAIVVQIPGNQERRHADAVGLVRHDVHHVFRDRIVHRRTALLPVREKLVQRRRLEHGTRQDVRADLRAFFHQAHGQLGTRGFPQLHQPARGAQACGTAPDDDDVKLHRFAFDLTFHSRFLSRTLLFEELKHASLWRARGNRRLYRQSRARLIVLFEGSVLHLDLQKGHSDNTPPKNSDFARRQRAPRSPATARSPQSARVQLRPPQHLSVRSRRPRCRAWSGLTNYFNQPTGEG